MNILKDFLEDLVPVRRRGSESTKSSLLWTEAGGLVLGQYFFYVLRLPRFLVTEIGF